MRVNEPDVVFQLFPDEVVILNLRVGAYYTTNNVGADMFGIMAAGASLEEALTLLLDRWENPANDMESNLAAFVGMLLQVGILVEQDQPSTAAGLFPARNPKLLPELPHLETHTDMQELLLLDPVHDVNEQGWPNKAIQE